MDRARATHHPEYTIATVKHDRYQLTLRGCFAVKVRKCYTNYRVILVIENRLAALREPSIFLFIKTIKSCVLFLTVYSQTILCVDLSHKITIKCKMFVVIK